MNRQLLVAVATVALIACNKVLDIDPAQQVGPNPVLPDPAEELVAAVGVPKVVGWKAGEAPSVPAGVQIAAMATGLANPRRVYTLPNGDILVVETDRQGTEPVDRPKDPIRDFLMSKANEGADYAKRRAEDLRDTAADTLDRSKAAVRRQKESLAAAVDAGRQAYRDTVNTPGAE